jgi:hypothetical protein
MKIVATVVLAVALSTGFAGAAVAKENYHENSVKADTKEAFVELAASVRKEMRPDGKYEYMKRDERTKIDAALDKMTKLFDETDSVAAMTQDQKIALFNAQETVNSILTLRDRDRVICKRENPVGSHIPVTSCHTYGQEIEAREGAKEMMSEWGRDPCRGACGGP